MKSYPKIKRQKSPDYLLWLRIQPCWICGTSANTNMDVVGAHQNITGGKMGGKSHDFFALPECTACHHLEHNPEPNYNIIDKFIVNQNYISAHTPMQTEEWDEIIECVIKEYIWRFLTQ